MIEEVEEPRRRLPVRAGERNRTGGGIMGIEEKITGDTDVNVTGDTGAKVTGDTDDRDTDSKVTGDTDDKVTGDTD
jgi:hypothetical protein